MIPATDPSAPAANPLARATAVVAALRERCVRMVQRFPTNLVLLLSAVALWTTVYLTYIL